VHAVTRVRRDRDRGGVAVLVALVLGSGVLLGMGALVVDVGNLYAEREELQGGADSAAVKVAQACALRIADCTSPNGAALSAGYANANAKDNTSDVTVVCGSGGTLLACPAPAGGPLACIKPAPATGNFVEVRTRTRLPDGTTVLPPTFAAALVSGFSGASVAACARAAWGPPKSGGLAVTVSICEWDSYTGAGSAFPDPPVDQVIYLHDNGKAGVCKPNGPSGADAPGGFGWLDDPNNDCRTPVRVNGTYDGDTGNSVSKACRDMLTALRDSGDPVLMPVYRAVGGTGSNITYTLEGLGAFVVTGWNLPGFTAASTLTNQDYCAKPSAGNGNSDTCIYGYFTKALVPGTAEIGGPDLGANVVALIG
jgi:Flp pilus assembly protein TadG